MALDYVLICHDVHPPLRLARRNQCHTHKNSGSPAPKPLTGRRTTTAIAITVFIIVSEVLRVASGSFS